MRLLDVDRLRPMTDYGEWLPAREGRMTCRDFYQQERLAIHEARTQADVESQVVRVTRHFKNLQVPRSAKRVVFLCVSRGARKGQAA